MKKNDQQALDNFLNQLGNSNIVNLLNLDENADPNLNFNKFMEHYMKLKKECLKKRLVRYNRKKHKINPWLTAGTCKLKSINSKDKLYKTLVQTPKDFIQLYYPILEYTKIILGEVLCMLNAITIVILLIDILPT